MDLRAMTMKRDETQLLLIDYQDKLVPAMHDAANVTQHISALVQAADILNVPITVTEQYPAGLGATIGDVARLLPDTHKRLSKLEFSALREEKISKRLEALCKSDLIICGCEAHVCVMQTAFDARREGYNVYCAWPAIASRHETDKHLAEERLRDLGATLVSTEMILFELVGSAQHKAFKQISSLVRSL